MTQEPQKPEDPKPAESPQSAWAPRPQTPSTPSSSETDSESAEAAPEAVATTASSEDTTASDAATEPATDKPDAAADSDTEKAAVASGPEAALEPAEQTPSPDAADAWEDVPVTPVPAAVATTTETPAATRRSGVPAWLVLFAAIIPAAIVGIAVYFLASGGDDEDPTAAAGVVDGLIRLGQANQSNISSYAGELPPDFSTEFPIYQDAKVVVSISMASEQGTGYLIVMSTPDSTGEVFEYYSDALDQEPWQVEVGRASNEFTGLRFLRPDNIDITGDVSLHRSSLTEQTVIYLSYTDISQAILPGGDSPPFSLGAARPLPAGFPEDIPIYEGAEESVILDTYFERGQGGRAYIVTFLTTDSEDAVIEFYRNEFEGRGWVVSDAGVSSTSFALAIEFDDGPDQSISGSITADVFEDDSAFTQVDLLVTTSGNRN